MQLLNSIWYAGWGILKIRTYGVFYFCIISIDSDIRTDNPKIISIQKYENSYSQSPMLQLQ